MNNQNEHQVKPPPLRGTLIHGTLWVFAARWLVRLIGLVSTVVLLAIMPLLPSAPTVMLALLVPSGAMIYAITLSMLWMLAGRPDGAEVFVFEQLHARLKRLHGAPAR